MANLRSVAKVFFVEDTLYSARNTEGGALVFNRCDLPAIGTLLDIAELMIAVDVTLQGVGVPNHALRSKIDFLKKKEVSFDKELNPPSS